MNHVNECRDAHTTVNSVAGCDYVNEVHAGEATVNSSQVWKAKHYLSQPQRILLALTVAATQLPKPEYRRHGMDITNIEIRDILYAPMDKKAVRSADASISRRISSLVKRGAVERVKYQCASHKAGIKLTDIGQQLVKDCWYIKPESFKQVLADYIESM